MDSVSGGDASLSLASVGIGDDVVLVTTGGTSLASVEIRDTVVEVKTGGGCVYGASTHGGGVSEVETDKGG